MEYKLAHRVLQASESRRKVLAHVAWRRDQMVGLGGFHGQ